MLGGNQETNRALNRRLIVNEIRRAEQITRSEIAELTGLSGAAVTFITSELISDGLLIEDPAAAGKRQRPLLLNYAAGFAVGIKLMEAEIRAVLTDLSTRVIAETTRTVNARDPEAVTDACASAFNDLIETNRVPIEKVAGIGLAMPGLVDARQGICVESGRIGWHYVPIGRLIAERAGVRVWVDNDVNAFALGEHLFGLGRHAQSVAVMTIGRGVGAGLVVNGAVFRGHRGGAGELGHIPIAIDGRLCECGRYGCLEAYVSEPSIVRQLRERSDDYRTCGPDDVLRLAQTGNFDALSVLDRAGGGLGRGLATLVNLLDPEVVVLAGEGVRFLPYFRKAMQGEFERLAFGNKHRIDVHSWGDDAWARGAAGLVVQQFFNFDVPPGAAPASPGNATPSETLELSYRPL
jgi:predicted NBD/HSP70 family sugar kinase